MDWIMVFRIMIEDAWGQPRTNCPVLLFKLYSTKRLLA